MVGPVLGRLLTLSLLGLMLAAPAAWAAQQKGVGETPPGFDSVEWVQGKPVKQFKRGDIYLVAFWSTASPETPRVIRELLALNDAHEQDRLQIVGLACFQFPQAEPAATYLKRRPEASSLTMARDKNDATLKTWAALVGELNDATAVLVDRKGRIAWSGSIFGGLDRALAAIVADDAVALEALAADVSKLDETGRKEAEALQKAFKARQWDKVLAAADAMLALDSRLFAGAAIPKYQALVSTGKKTEAAAFGREALAGVLHDHEGGLNELAWWIVDPDGRMTDSARDLDLALAVAERANELASERDAAILDTLARVHWRLGHRDEALELQEKAVSLAFGSQTKTLLQKSLDEFVKGPAPTPPAKTDEPATPAEPAGATPPPPPPPAEPDSDDEAPKN